MFNCIGKHYIFQEVTDDDYPSATSDSEQCDVWVFSMDLDMPNNPAGYLGVGDTTDLSLAYAPSNLYAGYKKLSVNAGGVVDVLQGSTPVISGTDKEQSWLLRSGSDPSTLTVKGVSPGQAILSLEYTPDGQVYPGTPYNADSVTVTVVGVYQIEVYASQWYDVTDYTITVLKGTKYTFRAKPNPTDAGWPPQRPIWTLNGNQIGAAGDTSVQVTFGSEGTKTLVAKCGATDPGKTVTINVIVPVLNTVEYRQNHALHNVNIPEYQRNPSQNEPGCWTVGTRAEARVTFWHSSALTYPTGNIVVRAETSGDSYNIEDWGNSAASTLGTNWSSSVITCVAEGTINDTVQYRDFSAQWKYKCVDGTNQWIETTNQTGCRLYVVVNTPTAPQTQPWKGVLDIACDVAWGRSDAEGAMYNLWDDFRWTGIYDTVDGSSSYIREVGGSLIFNLGSLNGWLSKYDEVGTVNCHDMGQAMVIFANALGCHADYTYVYSFGYLNCIKPIGCGWTNNPFYNSVDNDDDPIVGGNDADDRILNNNAGRSWFLTHGFATSSNGVIYDASAVYVDGDWDPDDGPCLLGLGLCQYDWNDYADKVIDDVPAPPLGTGSPTPQAFLVE